MPGLKHGNNSSDAYLSTERCGCSALATFESAPSLERSLKCKGSLPSLLGERLELSLSFNPTKQSDLNLIQLPLSISTHMAWRSTNEAMIQNRQLSPPRPRAFVHRDLPCPRRMAPATHHIDASTVRTPAHRYATHHNHVQSSLHNDPSSGRQMLEMSDFGRFLHARLNQNAHFLTHIDHGGHPHFDYPCNQIQRNMNSAQHIKVEDFRENIDFGSIPWNSSSKTYPIRSMPHDFSDDTTLVTIEPKAFAQNHQNFDLGPVQTNNDAPTSASTHAWSLPNLHLFTDFTGVPRDQATTLYKGINFHENAPFEPQPSYNHSPTASDAWNNASFSYEDMAASSPDSIESYGSELLTPASDSTASFNQYYAGSAHSIDSGSFIAVHQQNSLLYPQSSNIHCSRGSARSESPMFRIVDIGTKAVSQNSQAQPFLEDYEQGLFHNLEVQKSASFAVDPKTARPLMSREKQDRKLLQWRGAGMSYRDIKRKGGFREAESTLRGRYRALTKARETRVRKPRWETKDVDLLTQIVERFVETVATAGTKRSRKIPWKRVSALLQKNGASYPFASATCAKKWDELRKTK